MSIDMDDINYDALASTIRIEDVTSSVENRDIIRRLKENKIGYVKVSSYVENEEKEVDGELDYTRLIGWFGYFLGRSLDLSAISIDQSDILQDKYKSFWRGLCCNKSIAEIFFSRIIVPGGQPFQMLDPFFKNNHNLDRVSVSNCDLRDEGHHSFSLALGYCKSLKHIKIWNSRIEGGQIVDIILALSMHPQLETVELSRMSLGRNECTAMATLLRHTTKNLKTLNLRDNDIDDEGVEFLVQAVGGSKLLIDLNLSENQAITTEGWKSVSRLLEMPDCQLQNLRLASNNLGNDEARIFASALRGNEKLKSLGLYGNNITAEGWTYFSALLCDTSSVNNTYASNHTLDAVGEQPIAIDALLRMNRIGMTKRQIAIMKILHHHSYFNMEPFFEWEFKVLPLLIGWFVQADACIVHFDYPYDFNKIRWMMLSCIYEFVREFPMLYIEACTRKEIEECSALEKKFQLQGDKTKVEKVQQRKARAMRRIGIQR